MDTNTAARTWDPADIDQEIQAAEQRYLALFPHWQTTEAQKCKADLESLKIWKMLRSIREAE